MKLQDGFVFNQASLQDFVDCPRRFQLRYLMDLSWPALPTEPITENEKFIQLGQLFHQMVHQKILGIQSVRLEGSIKDEELRQWWHNFDQFWENISNQQYEFFPEYSLSSSLDHSRLVAKFDLILVSNGNKFTIFDWKTSRRRPSQEILFERMQSRVYPYLLTKVGADLNGGIPVDSANIEMVYWHASFPDKAVRFSYNPRRFLADERYLINLIETIRGLDETSFFLTQDLRRCSYCVYRSLCDRGVNAGEFDGIEDFADTSATSEIKLDFEQIIEIEI
jgi:CRISPR/Cas system-associated exonuclease Cas4 (RecB family)